MKLQTVTCYAVEIPAKDGFYAMSRDRVLRSFPSTVVRVTAEDGTSGFAEACRPFARDRVLHRPAHALLLPEARPSGPGPQFDNGTLHWGNAPGLGVDVDEDVLGPPIFQLAR
jgi:L-alanine-DL-glutamate epimerase-like enolase superfamily enzyme